MGRALHVEHPSTGILRLNQYKTVFPCVQLDSVMPDVSLGGSPTRSWVGPRSWYTGTGGSHDYYKRRSARDGASIAR